jgi:hypothetical protein
LSCSESPELNLKSFDTPLKHCNIIKVIPDLVYLLAGESADTVHFVGSDAGAGMAVPKVSGAAERALELAGNASDPHLDGTVRTANFLQQDPRFFGRWNLDGAVHPPLLGNFGFSRASPG